MENTTHTLSLESADYDNCFAIVIALGKGNIPAFATYSMFDIPSTTLITSLDTNKTVSNVLIEGNQTNIPVWMGSISVYNQQQSAPTNTNEMSL